MRILLTIVLALLVGGQAQATVCNGAINCGGGEIEIQYLVTDGAITAGECMRPYLSSGNTAVCTNDTYRITVPDNAVWHPVSLSVKLTGALTSVANEDCKAVVNYSTESESATSASYATVLNTGEQAFTDLGATVPKLAGEHGHVDLTGEVSLAGGSIITVSLEEYDGNTCTTYQKGYFSLEFRTTSAVGTEVAQ